MGFPGDDTGKEIPLPMQEMEGMWFQTLDGEDTLEKEMETHASILAWRIPWTEEPGGLYFMGSRRVGHAKTKPRLLDSHEAECQRGQESGY